LPLPVPLQAPSAHPAQLTHWASPGHCASLVHQHGTPAAVHWPPGDVTLSQLPIEQDQVLATEVAVSQSWLSCGPVPVQVPVHWLLALMHLPLEQSESLTQTHAEPPDRRTGGGVRVVEHEVPPVPMQGMELGGASHWCSSAAPDPVQLDPHAVPFSPMPVPLGTHLPLAH